VVADVSRKAGCDDLIAKVKARFDKLHILVKYVVAFSVANLSTLILVSRGVSNSGVTWGAPFHDFPEIEGWDRVMNLNVKVRYRFQLL
jgi:NAD(P)-dependent dehydrogenase (short-subunit alcohol dehydrogenase family)